MVHPPQGQTRHRLGQTIRTQLQLPFVALEGFCLLTQRFVDGSQIAQGPGLQGGRREFRANLQILPVQLQCLRVLTHSLLHLSQCTHGI